MRRLAGLGLVLATAVVVAACASQQPAGGPTATPPSSSSVAQVTSSPDSSPGDSAGSGTTASAKGSDAVLDSLTGRTFVSTEVTGHDLVPGSTIRMTFPSAGTISVNAGCNTMSGAASVDGGVLRVGQLASTAMGCPQPLADQDTWLAGLLTAGMAIDVHGSTVVLSADGVTITLTDREVAEPDLPFVGTNWVLDGIVANDAVTHYGVVATLSTDGTRITYRACNTHSGDITIEGTTATTTMMLGTTMACGDARDEVERAMEAVLNGTFTFAVDGNDLTVTGADGTGLTFIARPAGAGTSGATTAATTSGRAPGLGAPSPTTMPRSTGSGPTSPMTTATSRPGGASLTMPPRGSVGRHDSIPPQPTPNTANLTY